VNDNLPARLKKLQEWGDRFRKENIDEKYSCYELEHNWWKALEFFFDHAFYRGRRDSLSRRYEDFTVAALARYFRLLDFNGLRKAASKLKTDKRFFGVEWIREFKARHSLDKKANSVKHAGFSEVASRNAVIKALTIPNSKGVWLNNDKDVLMVLDVLNRISAPGQTNIYRSVLSKLKEEGIRAAFVWLDTISNIGDKLACFTIRDVLFLNPDVTISEEKDFYYAFPVDVWVAAVAVSLGCESEKEYAIKKFIISGCLQNRPRLCPLRVNAGMFYVGFNAVKLVLDNLISI
jgi:hypothetical protein